VVNHTIVGAKDVYTVASHHHVLKAWAEIRRGMAAPPNLITLDHHTDTLEPFLRHVGQRFEGFYDNSEERTDATQALIQSIDFRNDESIDRAIQLLRNDAS
jgi:hypothetical protein